MIDQKGSFRIGKLARLAEVGVETIRYYERRGLLDEPQRSPAIHHRGYRCYTYDAVERLRFIRRAKRLGFTLEQIVELLTLSEQKGDVCEPIRHRIEEKLEDVKVRLRDLRRMKRALEGLIESCENKQLGLCGCPILASLSSKDTL